MFLLGNSMPRWEDGIKISFRKIFCEGEYWFELVQDRAKIKGEEIGEKHSTRADEKLYNILVVMPEGYETPHYAVFSVL